MSENKKIVSSNNLSKFGQGIINIVNDKINEKTSCIKTVEMEFTPVNIVNEVLFSEIGYYANPANGEIVNTEYTQAYKNTNYLSINSEDQYGSIFVSQVCYYDENKNFISSQSEFTNQQIEIDGKDKTLQMLEVPQGAKFLIANFIDSGGVPSIYQLTNVLNKRIHIENLDLYDTVSTFKKTLLTGKNFVFFGDSITEFGSYPEQIGDLLDANTVNVGVGGTRMSLGHPEPGYDKFSFAALSDAIASSDFSEQEIAVESIKNSDDNSEQLEKLKNIDWYNVDGIVLLYGTNDFGGGVTIGDLQTDKWTFIGSLRYAVSKILNKYPHVKFYVVSPIYRWLLPNGSTDSDAETSTINSNHLYDFADALSLACSKLNIPYLNLYRTSNINSINYQIYLDSDGVHPNNFGFTHIAEKISKFLLSESSSIPIDVIATKKYVMDALDGKTIRYVTQAQYEALPDTEKNREDIVYQITDAELSYNDLVDKPDLSVYATKEEVAEVGFSGDYSDLENKPCYDTRTGGIIEYSGIISDYDAIDAAPPVVTFIKISDRIIRKEDIIGAVMEYADGDTTKELILTEDNITDLDDVEAGKGFMIQDSVVFFVEEELVTTVSSNEVIVPPGIWSVVYYGEQSLAPAFTLTISENGGELKQLDEKFIPDTIARKSDVPNITIITQADYDAIEGTDQEDPDTFYLISDEL